MAAIMIPAAGVIVSYSWFDVSVLKCSHFCLLCNEFCTMNKPIVVAKII